MKTKIVTVISFAGVLIAGSAAALVNTQVLGGSASRSPLVVDAASPVQQTTPQSVPSTLPATAATLPTATTSATPAVAAAAPIATEAVYAIGDSGTVTLDAAGERLTIVSVTPADGWTVTKSEASDDLNVEVKFQSSTTEVDFHANLLFGVVTTSVDSHDTSIPNGTVQNSGSHNGGSDDSSETHSGGADD